MKIKLLIHKIKYSIIIFYNLIIDYVFDWYYGVETCKEDELKENSSIQYSYQVFYSLYLIKIFKKYYFKPEDCLVDFGCGKWRVLIMSAVYNCTQIIGIEINTRMCEMAKQNINAFRDKFHVKANIEVVNENAQFWNIGKEYNKFFSSTPFI